MAACGLVVWAWVVVAAGQGRGGGQGRDIWVDNLPPGQGQGKELAAQRCSGCHTLERTVQLRKSRDEWEGIVYDMIGRGAPIFLDEAKEIIVYLSDVFGPNSPPFIDVNRASKDELIKVPGITAGLADQLLAHRATNGALSSRDQIREILRLDEKTYERIRYYLHAAPPTASPGAAPADR
jgi:rRNA processing protein Gar1